MNQYDHLDELSLDERTELELRLLGLLGQAPVEQDVIPVTDETSVALSWTQHGIWLTQQLDPETPAYHLLLHTRWTGALDRDRLAAALDAVVRAHDGLRTRVHVANDSAPVQEVVPAATAPLPLTDLSGLPDAERDRRFAQVAESTSDEPFDLARAPLLRARLLRLAEGEHVLLLVVHHLVADGASANVIFDDLIGGYRGDGVGPAAAVGYLDHAVWRRDRPYPDANLDYWRARLAGRAGTVDLPADRPRPAARSFRGARRPVRVAAGRLARLRALAAEHEASTFAVMLASVNAALHRYATEDDLVIGVAADQRDRPELARLVGLLVDMLPIRTNTGGDPSFAELVGRTRDAVLDGITHRDARFDLVPEQAGAPLFEVAFTFMESAPLAWHDDGMDVRFVDLGGRGAQFDLTFSLIGHDDELTGYLEYRTDLFGADRAEELCAYWEDVLRAVTDDPAAPLSALPPAPQGIAHAVEPSGAPAQAAPDDLADTLLPVWAELLGDDSIGQDTDFFAHGGTSLGATRLLARLRTLLTPHLSLRALFANPSPAGFAAHVRTLGLAAPAPAPRPDAADEQADHALSLAQQRIWFVNQLEPDQARYSVPITLQLTGTVDVDALGHALTAVVARHAVLRSVYPQVDGQPVQRATPPAPVPVRVTDLTSAPEDVDTWLRGEVARPFDLDRGPLIRVELARTGPESAVLLINIHHIVFDRWSGENLFGELSELYQARIADRPARLPELPVQYAEVARWQQDWLRGDEARAQLDYWRTQFDDVPPPLTLRCQRERPKRRERPGRFVNFTVPAAVRDGVLGLCGSGATTPFMVLMAAFQAVLARASGQDAFAVGTPIGNRAKAEFEPLIGFFVNTLVLRADLSGDPTFTELLARVRATAIDAYVHQDLPFDRIVQELRIDRQGNRDPLFDVMLTYQNVPPGAPLTLPGATAQLRPFTEWVAKRDLTLRIENGVADFGAALEFDADLFTEPDMRRLADDFVATLTALVANPRARLFDGRPAAPSGRRAFQRLLANGRKGQGQP